MSIRTFDAGRDTRRVLELWETALGETYPVTERVFRGQAVARFNYEPGDGVVALRGRQVVGFAMVEIPRPGDSGVKSAYVSAILVHPDLRREGIGREMLRRLERRALRAGCAKLHAGRGPARFWTGIPEDLPAARQFFAANGFELGREAFDLVVPLGDYASRTRYLPRLAEAGAEVVSADTGLLPALLDFELREFKGWAGTIIRYADAGDLENVLVVRRGEEIVGTILTYTPQSRWRGPNLVWERIHGADMGGYGAVGIAAKWRGRGLGAAMCEAAALHVEEHGASCCYIDWTGIVDFYRKVGAEPWRRFCMAEKSLGRADG